MQLEKLYPKGINIKARSAQRSYLQSDIKLEKSLALKKEIINRNQDSHLQSVAKEYDSYKSPIYKASDLDYATNIKM